MPIAPIFLAALIAARVFKRCAAVLTFARLVGIYRHEGHAAKGELADYIAPIIRKIDYV
jgi:hypothetical protein